MLAFIPIIIIIRYLEELLYISIWKLYYLKLLGLLLFSPKVVSNAFVTPLTVAHQAHLRMGFPGKNTGVGCHFLLQQTFLTQGLTSCLLHLLHWRVGSLHWVTRGWIVLNCHFFQFKKVKYQQFYVLQAKLWRSISWERHTLCFISGYIWQMHNL